MSIGLAIYFLFLKALEFIGYYDQLQKHETPLVNILSWLGFQIYEIVGPILILYSTKHTIQDQLFPSFREWQLIAWAAFFLWIRFILVLRSNQFFNDVISMV